MSRAIDHIVLCVNDLDAAIAVYTQLGFTVTPRAVHPFGTGNALIQLDGMYIELLAVIDPDKIAETDLAQPFSFPIYNRDYLRHREGMSMLALQSRDAEQDRQKFIAAGAAVPPVFHFERDAKTPDGETVGVAFSLAYANHPLLRHAVTFVCQHRHPVQNFYFPDYQSHQNGAVAIGKVLVDHWAAEAVRDFYEEIGVDAIVDALHGDELISRYGVEDSAFPTDGFAGFELIVDDIAKIADAAVAMGAVEKDGMLIIPPSRFFGVLMVIKAK
ncbi:MULTISPECIES: VOC family protein [unclassified Thalassospira]|uniref:VOC family protein n=1 Tax=unclassified Thalassospira TaxID=2648997 RepID=UPI000ECDE631|nr:VOC family protein [Thalassospira sp. UBA4513]HAI32042.1 VOC family protein [Thalassospira sp.]